MQYLAINDVSLSTKEYSLLIQNFFYFLVFYTNFKNYSIYGFCQDLGVVESNIYQQVVKLKAKMVQLVEKAHIDISRLKFIKRIEVMTVITS